MSDLAEITLTVECKCGFKEVWRSDVDRYVDSFEVRIDYPGDEDEQAILLFSCPQCKKEVRVKP